METITVINVTEWGHSQEREVEREHVLYKQHVFFFFFLRMTSVNIFSNH